MYIVRVFNSAYTDQILFLLSYLFEEILEKNIIDLCQYLVGIFNKLL